MTRTLALIAAVFVGIGLLFGHPQPASTSSEARAPLSFPNNVNTILQKDSFGENQNLACYDADSGLFIGPGSDPRTTIYANVPINLFRRHVFVDFEEANGLDHRCVFHKAKSASGSPSMGVFQMRTGTTSGSRAELLLPNVSAPAYAGQRIYFYLRTYPAGNLRLRFGLRHPNQDTIAIGFSRTDTGGPKGLGGDYVALTSNGKSGATETRTGAWALPGGDAVRRLFCINVTKSQNALGHETGCVEFYVGTDGGVLERKATHTAHIPDVVDAGLTQHLVPFVSLENNAAVDQGLDVDVIYGVLLR